MWFLDDVDVFLVGDIPSSHGSEVRRFKLAVDESTSKYLKHTCEVDEGILGGIRHQREHALAKERGPKVPTLEPTHQPIFLPHLDTGGKALTMEFGIGLDDVRA